MNRRHFNALASASLGSLLTRKLWAEQAQAFAASHKFYIALVADPHIIDTFYKPGSENGVEDNESILVTTPRLTSARDLINSLHPAIEQVFLLGDYFHNYPSPDYDFYFQNTTRLDNAKTITDGFHMPVHLGFGNHDYDVRNISREISHRLFAAKFNAQPYSSLDYKGFRFIHLSNFLGRTQDRTAPDFNPSIGSLGEEQLHWFEAQLEQRKPTFVFIHYPLIQDAPTEFADYGLLTPCASIRRPFNSSSPAICTSGSTSPTPTARRTMSWPPPATTPTPTCCLRLIPGAPPGDSRTRASSTGPATTASPIASESRSPGEFSFVPIVSSASDAFVCRPNPDSRPGLRQRSKAQPDPGDRHAQQLSRRHRA